MRLKGDDSVAKQKTIYTCRECGASASKWNGQCSDCQAWNTLEESLSQPDADKPPTRFGNYAGTEAQICALDQVETIETARISCGLSEFDRVLGGGLVIWLSRPDWVRSRIGKSTVLLQTMSTLSQRDNLNPLYVTGEESPQQVSLRAQRLQLDVSNLNLLTETNIERIIRLAQQHKPRVLVIDSIQTVHTDLLQSAPGAVAQVRESAAQLVPLCQTNRHDHLSGWTCHQRRCARRPARIRTHGRYCPLL